MQSNKVKLGLTIVGVLIGVLIFSIFLFFVGFILFGLLLAENPEISKAAKILNVLNSNWKVLLILVLIPFYRPIYRFIARLAWIQTPWGAAGVNHPPSPLEQHQPDTPTADASSPQREE